MCRSISEVPLFKDDDDKKTYLARMKKYQKLYEFKVYGYCLMDTHCHFIIDINGSDISRVMHAINFSYAIYFNKRHKRHGHLFQDRFKSKMVNNDEYLLTLSAYIHNNPIDISQYENCPEEYSFSTLAVYLGLRSDPFELVDTKFVMSFFSENTTKARENYISLVYKCNTKEFKEEYEFENEGTEYRSGRTILVRDADPDKIIEFIAAKLEVSEEDIKMKNSRGVVEAKALLVVLMRSLCNFTCTAICSKLGNITQSRVSKLSSRGIELVSKDEKYRGIVREFLESYAA
jgi:putative transposase